MAPIHPSVAVVVPLSLDIGHRSSHTDQCIETSAATCSSETPAQESSTFLHVQLFRCCGVGTRSDVGVLGLGEHRPSHGSGGDHLAQTILPTGRIWSSLPEFLHHFDYGLLLVTVSECLPEIPEEILLLSHSC